MTAVRHRAAAVRFGAELRRAMSARGAKGVAVIALAGIPELDAPALSEIRHGRRLASMEVATALADAIGWPRLSTLMLELRRGTCGICGRAFVDPSRDLRQVWCSRACQQTSTNRRRRGMAADLRIVEAHRLADHQQAVEAFCRQCEPEGMCRDAACALRPVSPLPLALRRSA